jgi:hypothetical protein
MKERLVVPGSAGRIVHAHLTLGNGGVMLSSAEDYAFSTMCKTPKETGDRRRWYGRDHRLCRRPGRCLRIGDSCRGRYPDCHRSQAVRWSRFQLQRPGRSCLGVRLVRPVGMSSDAEHVARSDPQWLAASGHHFILGLMQPATAGRSSPTLNRTTCADLSSCSEV